MPLRKKTCSMQAKKLNPYEEYRLKSLHSALMMKMGDLYCYVWDLKNSAPELQQEALKRIGKSCSKCVEILKEVEKRGH